MLRERKKVPAVTFKFSLLEQRVQKERESRDLIAIRDRHYINAATIIYGKNNLRYIKVELSKHHYTDNTIYVLETSSTLSTYSLKYMFKNVDEIIQGVICVKHLKQEKEEIRVTEKLTSTERMAILRKIQKQHPEIKITSTFFRIIDAYLKENKPCILARLSRIPDIDLDAAIQRELDKLHEQLRLQALNLIMGFTSSANVFNPLRKEISPFTLDALRYDVEFNAYLSKQIHTNIEIFIENLKLNIKDTRSKKELSVICTP